MTNETLENKVKKDGFKLFSDSKIINSISGLMLLASAGIGVNEFIESKARPEPKPSVLSEYVVQEGDGAIDVAKALGMQYADHTKVMDAYESQIGDRVINEGERFQYMDNDAINVYEK